jgi:hypothetical protein
MNQFVNLKKRGVQLPKGCKNLVDVLQAKCEYCDAAAVATLGRPGDYRWCEVCQRDLKEFAKIEVHEFRLVFNTSDEAAISRFRAGIQRRQDDFMRQ